MGGAASAAFAALAAARASLSHLRVRSLRVLPTALRPHRLSATDLQKRRY